MTTTATTPVLPEVFEAMRPDFCEKWSTRRAPTSSAQKWANNETGVLFPVKEIADFCRSRGVLYAHPRRASGAESARRNGVRTADCRHGQGGGSGAETIAGLGYGDERWPDSEAPTGH
jgi:hypothetical protein